MEATVIDTGTVDPSLAFNMTINIPPPQEAIEYFNNMFQDFYNRVGTYSQQFVEQAKQVMNYFNNNEILNKAKQSVLQYSRLRDDVIMYLTEENIHNAGLMMRRYIMAEPTVFHRYVNNRVDGWGDVWYQEEMDIPPTWRDDYLYATDGILILEDEYGYTRQYGIESNPLEITDRLIINEVWDTVELMLSKGIDPTKEK